MQNLIAVISPEIVNLPIDKIIPNPYQPRKILNKASLEELSRSILKNGIIQPLKVRCINDKIYELVVGERRLMAAKLAGLKEIPAVIVNISDKDTATAELIENIQRENLSFIEEAQGYQDLMVDFGYTQEEIADLMGKELSHINDKLMLLKLSKKIKNIIINEDLKEGHAKAVLKINNELLQEEILKKVIKYGLNVTRTEELIESTLKKLKGAQKEEPKIKGYINDIRLFTNTIKGAVNIMREAGIKTDYKMIRINDGYEIRIKVIM